MLKQMERNTMDPKELEIRFAYHAPKEGQADMYALIRNMAKVFAEEISRLCPPSREESLALTKLEEVVMWANAAIARRS